MALGRILSQTLRREERLTAPAPQAPAVALSKNLNRLLSAAVVSPRFCTLLLSNPAAALAAGYNGEMFPLTPTEYTAVTSLCANNVRDFAAQLLLKFYNANESALYGPDAQSTYRFVDVATQ